MDRVHRKPSSMQPTKGEAGSGAPASMRRQKPGRLSHVSFDLVHAADLQPLLFADALRTAVDPATLKSGDQARRRHRG